jgi:hypothetical protein
VHGDTTEEFAISLGQSVEDRLGRDSGPGWLKRDVFVQVVSEYLVEDGVLEDLQVCYYVHPAGRSRMEVAGYAISDDGSVLDLVVADYGHDGQAISRDQVLKRLRWAKLFATACRDQHHLNMEESSAEYDMVQTISANWREFDKVRIFLVTDGRATVENLPGESLDGLPIVQYLWDIERIRRLATSGRHEEPITIHFGELGGPLQCLPASGSDSDHQCFLTVIPGQVLAQMYDQHGAKLLQRNIRAFLQARGKVNKGINETIRENPGRFLAYNNGISATATGVTLDERPDGTFLVKLHDLQIVNGGQTTASLHHAARRDRADLSEVQVPAKITVVEPELLDELVPRISRYANSQNTINEADFESNSPFHVELERLSRGIWTPAMEGPTRESHWYYERVRGQYQVERAKRPTAAQQKSFDKDNPRGQKFTKTDAAKYELTFLQAPHVVSLGAQKCFQHWTLDVLANRSDLPDEQYFRNLVAKRIFFEESRKEIQRQNPGAGYLANVTTYTIARLVQEDKVDLVLQSVWRAQHLADETLDMVTDLSRLVRRVLLAAPGSGNVTEWCKKEDCWKSVLDIAWTVFER